jgi:hypothetical protein
MSLFARFLTGGGFVKEAISPPLLVMMVMGCVARLLPNVLESFSPLGFALV